MHPPEDTQQMLTNLYFIGTVAYMAPEAFHEKFGGVTCKTDIYGFGIMLNEMVTMHPPWSGLQEASVIYKVN